MSEKKRKAFDGPFKAKVALEAIRGIRTTNEIAQVYGVHPTQVGLWKKELQEQAAELFEVKRGVARAFTSERAVRRVCLERPWFMSQVQRGCGN